MQGGRETGRNGPIRAGTPGCEQADRGLAIALAGELPVPAPAQVLPVADCAALPRSAVFDVPGGSLYVGIAPANAAVAATPAGTAQVTRRTADGATLVLGSVPAPGSAAPYADRLGALADALAGRY